MLFFLNFEHCTYSRKRKLLGPCTTSKIQKDQLYPQEANPLPLTLACSFLGSDTFGFDTSVEPLAVSAFYETLSLIFLSHSPDIIS